MNSPLRSAALAAGLLLAALAAAASVGAWRAERSLAAGRSALRSGDLNGALASFSDAAARGSADAAEERVRIAVALRNWSEAETGLRDAMALAPTRGRPHLLRAGIEAVRPGPWDMAREERLLESCRVAVMLEPAPARLRRECADLVLGMYLRRRPSWDGPRAAAVLGEAIGGYGEALARQPLQAPAVLGGILDTGGGPELLVEAALRGGDPAALAAAAAALARKGVWTAEQSRSHVAATSGDAGGWFLLGEILRRSGRPGDAREAYREAARLAPGVEAYRRAAGG